MRADGADFSAIRESIELGLAPPSPSGAGRPRAALRRLSLMISRPRARHQLMVDRQLLHAIEASQQGLDGVRTWLHNNSARLEALGQGVQELREWISGLAAHVDGLAARVDGLAERAAPVEAFVAASRALPEPNAIGLEQFDAGPAGTVMGYRQGARSVGPLEDYVSFEDVFRLSEDVIRERQRPYLAVIGDRQPVLDAGCGRGEFLELLRDAGIQASGVDLDAGMVARARAKGLDVKQRDAVTYLEGVPDRSLGAVFAAQVVEHLPYGRLLAFLRLSAQKLAPRGLLIAETVNPHAPGALKNFWLDLTHQHPVFPEVLLTLCRSVGFESAYVFHPGGSGDVFRDRERAGDYALIAERLPIE